MTTLHNAHHIHVMNGHHCDRPDECTRQWEWNHAIKFGPRQVLRYGTHEDVGAISVAPTMRIVYKPGTEPTGAGGMPIIDKYGNNKWFCNARNAIVDGPSYE